METVHIYLAGAMSGLDFDEQNGWRKEFEKRISQMETEKKVVCFNPVDYFNFKEKRYKTEKEIIEFDLYNLRNSDLVIVNYNDPNSIGTAMEIAIAHEYRTPVVGLNKGKRIIHSWLETCTTRMCNSMDELVNYVCDFYLN